MSQKFRPRREVSIKKQVEAVQRQRMLKQKVVDLNEFRNLQKGSQQPTILAVDDDEIIRSALKRFFEGEGYKVVLAEDAMGLSKLIEVMPLDLILLDINLPWVDGLELCSMLKRHDALRGVPLILMSGRRSKEDIEAGFHAGCDDYLTKPFDLEQMAAAVEQVLKRPAVE